MNGTYPLVWTAQGKARQQKQVDERRARHETLRRFAETNFSGVAHLCQDRAADYQSDKDELARAKQDLDDAEALLARIRVAPQPRQFETVQVGHEVRIRYLDNCTRKKRGEEESFILGGKFELDEDSVLRTFSCQARLGSAIVRKEVGEQVEVHLKDGSSYRVEILSLGLPQTQDTKEKASA